MTCHGQRGEFTESRGQEANGKIKAGTGDGGHGQRLCAGLGGGGVWTRSIEVGCFWPETRTRYGQSRLSCISLLSTRHAQTL